jgi:hypothetical protein
LTRYGLHISKLNGIKNSWSRRKEKEKKRRTEWKIKNWG